MDYRVVITQPAVRDLADIVRMISRDKPEAARRFGEALINEAESLQTLPQRGRVVPERTQRDCREIVHKPIRIIYRIQEGKKTIEVLRFWHGARGTPILFEEDSAT